ncbi:MAG: EAL domain-containing protein [Oscillospiraceae bacterium]|nr:EAL domain-containing protein [Oscillospiraceae bacterium]
MAYSNGINTRRLVLVVDDQEINRELLEMFLSDDYDLLFAENGQQAMELIRAHQDMLSIVLLDLMMPVMDGFQVLAAVHADEALRRIPIIVLTAERAAELRALQLGAADFITKPFDMHEIILARVARIIELSEGRTIIQAAERDELTGLYTGNFFFQYAERINRYHPDWDMDAVVLNIERFHLVNDLYGRDFGDRVLGLIGEAILDQTNGVGAIGGRMEADQFCVYIRHAESYQELLEALQSRLASISGNSRIRLRTGVCPRLEGIGDLQSQFDKAKIACNMLRGNFSRDVMYYDMEMHRKEVFSEGLVNDIHRAVEERQFQVYFQPKYGIQGPRPALRSAEALIRWKHPDHGMISPGAFIPLFEQNGLIQMVDEYVWAETARQIAAWKAEYGFTLPVSVNLSRVDVYDPALEEKLLGLVETNGLTTHELKLEVTESAYTDDPEQLVARVQHLRDLGFQIEMDDFGSGYSSLNMISTLPIDVLKMDMKFIQNVKKGNEKDFKLIELVLDIAEFLHVPVVAEGVETAEQCEMLRQAGCSLVQGYYFSRPIPPAEFARLIEKELNDMKLEG